MSHNNPLISVIIPVHDRFLLVNEAVVSVINQTYKSTEIIIVDDFSPIPYKPSVVANDIVSISVIRNYQNLGPGVSREIGRLAAHGDYIAYLDSDDLWHTQFLEKLVAKLRENPNAGMCYCRSIEFTDLPLAGNEPFRKRSNQKFSNFLPTIFWGRPWGTSACLWTRDAVEKNGSWINAWTWEDYEYDCRAGCNDILIEYVPETLCYYRQGDEIEKLSVIDEITAYRRRFPSIISMSQYLQASEKILIKENRIEFLRILKRNVIALIKYNESLMVKKLLGEIISTNKISGHSLFCFLMMQIVKATLGVRFLRKIQVNLIQISCK